jgi:hypothetical protein
MASTLVLYIFGYTMSNNLLDPPLFIQLSVLADVLQFWNAIAVIECIIELSSFPCSGQHWYIMLCIHLSSMQDLHGTKLL